MDANFSQLLCITLWAFCCGIDQFCGLLQIHRPLVSGLVIGMILGDLSSGIIAGSVLELVFLGIMPLSGAKPMNIAVGGILGVTLAILMKVPPEAAAAMAVPFAIMAHGLISFTFIIYSILINKADCWVGNTAIKSIINLNYSGIVMQGIACALTVFVTIYYGVEEAQKLSEIIPAWVLGGLVSAGGMLPGLGLALLLHKILGKQYIPFLLFGFLMTTAFYVPLALLFGMGLCIALYDFHHSTVIPRELDCEEYTDSTVNKIITRHDLNVLMLRSLLLQASFNFERMQAGGWLFSLLPSLQKIHRNENDLKKSLTIHLDFFNTSPFLVNFIMGVVVALEENKQSRQLIKAVKLGMMVPLQGIGDAVYLLGILPLTAALGTSLVMDDKLNVWGILIFLLVFNVIHLGVRFQLTKFGYRMGNKCVYIIKDNFEKYYKAALILGTIMIGGLITYLVRINISWVITVGLANVALQAKLFDAILPNMIPLLYTVVMVYLLRKDISLNSLVIGTIIFALCGTGFGIM